MKLGPLRLYPTRRALVVAALGAVVSLPLGFFAPRLPVGLIWCGAVVALLLADLLLGALGFGLSATLDAPPLLALGETGEATLALAFRGAGPRTLQAALGADTRLLTRATDREVPVSGRKAAARFQLEPQRRGQAQLEAIWMRWTGPLGLVWRQRSGDLDQRVVVTADVRRAKGQALRFNARAPIGERTQLDQGFGSEFQSLREFPAEGDRRTIDWKRSARHGRLLSKEFRPERNHTVVLVFDTGRQMSEVVDGEPRIDRALSAGLALAWASLADGDRVKLFGFDSKIRLSTGFATRPSAFTALQRLSADLDYSAEATNYTLGLFTLAGELDRRSIVVVFTEFTDPTGAELMVASIGRLVARHMVIFVTFRDRELEALAAAQPTEPSDVTRAVVAQGLLDTRRLVVERLRRLGVRIVETDPENADTRVIDAYLDVKRRELA